MPDNDLFDADVLRDIAIMPYDKARKLCIDLVSDTKTKAKKKQRLLLDLNAAPDSKELARIMYNVVLSGMGLATLNSKWQEMYG